MKSIWVLIMSVIGVVVLVAVLLTTLCDVFRLESDVASLTAQVSAQKIVVLENMELVRRFIHNNSETLENQVDEISKETVDSSLIR